MNEPPIFDSNGYLHRGMMQTTGPTNALEELQRTANVAQQERAYTAEAIEASPHELTEQFIRDNAATIRNVLDSLLSGRPDRMAMLSESEAKHGMGRKLRYGFHEKQGLIIIRAE